MLFLQILSLWIETFSNSKSKILATQLRAELLVYGVFMSPESRFVNFTFIIHVFSERMMGGMGQLQKGSRKGYMMKHPKTKISVYGGRFEF